VGDAPYDHIDAKTKIAVDGSIAFQIGDPVPLATADRLGIPYVSGDIILGTQRSGPTPTPVYDWATHSELFRALAASLDPLIAGIVTRDGNGAMTAAPVLWPNGVPGVYTATALSSAFPGAVDAYTVTYGSSPVIRTYTQPAVTRDGTGAVTTRPAVTVT
jgi:hypothetical protein